MRTLLGVAAVCLLLLFPNPSLAHPDEAPRTEVGPGRRRHRPAASRPGRHRPSARLGQRQQGRGLEDQRRREDLDRRQPSGRHGPAAPRRRDPAARARPGAGDRRGRRQPDLPHHRRWRDLDPDVHQRRPGRVLRLHGDVARRQAGDRDERPGRREVPDHRDQRRRRVVVGGRPGRHARRGARRGRLRRERHLPGRASADATRTSRPVSAPSRIFHSRDRGHTWTVRDSTIPANAETGGGVFSLSFRNARQALAVGGDLGDRRNGVDMSAYLSKHGTVVDQRRRPGRLPVRRRLAPPGPRDRGRRRADRQRRDVRRRAALDDVRRRGVRLRAVHEGRRVLDQRPGGRVSKLVR